MRGFRRGRKPSAPPRPAPAAEPLFPALYAYLLDELHNAPRDLRLYGQWVMNTEWLNECRKIDDRPSRFALHLLPTGVPETLLGLPIDIRDDGGMPHLEPRPMEPIT